VLLHINRPVGFSSCLKADILFTVLITSNPPILIAAEKVTGNLAHLTSQVTPGDVCSVYGIRKAMGVSLPNDTAQDTFTHLTTGNVNAAQTRNIQQVRLRIFTCFVCEMTLVCFIYSKTYINRKMRVNVFSVSVGDIIEPMEGVC
jgi:hypothetical protein